MGELAASIAHEINQPLTGVVSNGNACLHCLRKTSRTLMRCDRPRNGSSRTPNVRARLSRAFRTLVAKSGQEMMQLDFNDAIREVLVLMRSELHKHDVSLETALSDVSNPSWVTGFSCNRSSSI